MKAPGSAYEDMSEVMSPRMLAEYLAVSVATLAGWRDKRVGPAWFAPPGVRLVRYSRHDVSAWLEASRNVTTPHTK